jgi:hypothetical protein
MQAACQPRPSIPTQQKRALSARALRNLRGPACKSNDRLQGLCILHFISVVPLASRAAAPSCPNPSPSSHASSRLQYPMACKNEHGYCNSACNARDDHVDAVFKDGRQTYPMIAGCLFARGRAALRACMRAGLWHASRISLGHAYPTVPHAAQDHGRSCPPQRSARQRACGG